MMERGLKVYKVYKVHKVTGVLRTMFIGSSSCRGQSAPQGSINLMNFINFINLINFMNSMKFEHDGNK